MFANNHSPSKLDFSENNVTGFPNKIRVIQSAVMAVSAGKIRAQFREVRSRKKKNQ